MKCLATVVALALVVYGFSAVLSIGGNAAALGAAQAQGAKDIDGSVKQCLRVMELKYETPSDGVYEIKDEQYSLRYHVFKQDERLMVLVVLNEKVPARFRPAVIEYLTRINYGAMVIGNFEMDLSDGEVQFRTSVDVEHGSINPEMVAQMTQLAVGYTEQYGPGIDELYKGKTPEQVFDAISADN